MSLLLGIDVATTGAKAILVDETGRVLASAANEYAFDSPRPRWAEQDPRDWWDATCRSIRRVLERAKIDPADIAGVGLTGQMHGLVALDDAFEPVRPCILWNDQRSIAESREIERRLGRDRLIEIAGKPPGPNFTAPKLLWIRAHEPDHNARIRHILLTKDYVRLQLTGRADTDVNDASGTLLFDVGRRQWAANILDALEVPRDWLPDAHESPTVCGGVTATAAKATGLVEGTPVIVGCGDQAADAIGLGVIAAGETSVTVGTSGVVFTALDACRTHEKGTLHAYCHAAPGRYYLVGVMLAAGGSFRWFRDELSGEARRRADAEKRDVYEVLVEQARETPPGCEGLVFLPYLTGERSPHADPDARGAFVGLTLRHTHAHLTRAVLEGITFGLLDSVRLIRDVGIDAKEIRVSGGGARSAFWRQLMADVFRAEIVTVNVTQGAAFGAAVLAGVGAGVFDDVAGAAAAAIRETARTRPSADVEKYPRIVETFRALYPALADTMHRLARVDES